MFPTIAFCQVKIGTNAGPPNSAAILELESTAKGFLLPRLSNNNRDSISSPPTGLMIFNISDSALQVNVGTPSAPVWQTLQQDKIRIVSSNNTLTANDRTIVITSPGINITLPSPAGMSGKMFVVVSQGNSSSISTYIDMNGSSKTSLPNNSSITLQSNGQSWYRIH